jgi:hypothetical protein
MSVCLDLLGQVLHPFKVQAHESTRQVHGPDDNSLHDAARRHTLLLLRDRLRRRKCLVTRGGHREKKRDPKDRHEGM